MLVHLPVAEMVFHLLIPRRRLQGNKACIRRGLPQQGLVLDEIYRLSHRHVSATLKLETGFTQQA